MVTTIPRNEERFRLGNEVVQSQEEFLRLACRLLAGRCDGARTHDGQGFGRFDQSFGHQMAEIPWNKWTNRQKYAVYQLISKYKNTQLRDVWHLIIAPPKPAEVDRFERQREASKHYGRNSGAIRLVQVNKTYYFGIDVPWSEGMMKRIKEIPGRIFSDQLKINLVPYRYDNIEPLFAFSGETGIPFDPKLLSQMMHQVEMVEDRLALSHASSSEFEIPGGIPEGLSLRPFQRAGIEYIVKHANGRGLVADEMGLGKTIQGLLSAKALGASRCVAVSPNSAKLNWKLECNKWWPEMPTVVVWGGAPKDAVDTIKRIKLIDKQLARYPDLHDAVVAGDKNIISDVIMRYQRRWNHESFRSDLINRKPQLDDGWTPEFRDLAIERMRLAKPMDKAGILPLFGNQWVCVINWDVLHSWEEPLRLLGTECVVGDEIHMAKNPKARRSKAFLDLVEDLKWVVGLSGTPVMNNALEFGQIIKLLGYLDVFGGSTGYYQRYVIGDDDGKKMSRTEVLQELNHRARARFMVRRIKKDVMPELPPLQHSTVPVVLSPEAQARYEEVEADIAAYFAQKSAMQKALVEEDGKLARQAGHADQSEEWQNFVFNRAKARYDSAYERAEMAKALLWFEGLKQICVEGKMQQMLDWIDDFLENSDQKLVVFASHTHVVEKVAARYNAPMIYGGTNVTDRQAAVEAFQQEDGGPRVIVGNLQAMGVALTLTKASNVAFLEFGWNPAAHDQAAGRCHRIGQKDSVTAWYLTAVRQQGEPTIDGEIVDIIAKKREIVDAITDGGGVEKDISIMKELASRIGTKAKSGKGNPEGPSRFKSDDQTLFALAEAGVHVEGAESN